MRSYGKLLIGCLTLLAVLPAGGWADVVVLDDGRRIEGLVIGESTVDVAVKLEGGTVVRFARKRVRGVERADFDYYMRKGEAATNPVDALEFYRRAKAVNRKAAGIDEKIREAEQRAAEAARSVFLEQQRAQRQLEEAKVMAAYQKFMDAGTKNADAQALLEEKIQELPWLAQPRIALAEFYAKDKENPESRVNYADVLAGLVRNDAETYYAEHAPKVVDAAESVLITDPTGGQSFSTEFKNQLVTLAAPFVGPDGHLRSVEAFQAALAEMQDLTSATLAKIEFVKNASLKRTGEQAVVGENRLLFEALAGELDTDEARAALQARVAHWSKQAADLVAGGEETKGAALGDVVLVYDPENTYGRQATAGARVREAARQRERGLLEQALKTLAEAETLMPTPEVYNEKARIHLAQFEAARSADNIAGAVAAIQEAQRANPSDEAVIGELNTQRDQLRDALNGMAQGMARQENFVAAIELTRMAGSLGGSGRRGGGLKALASTIIGGGGGGDADISEYQKKLAAQQYARVKAAADVANFDQIAGEKAIAMQYGAWTMANEKGETLEGLVQQQVDGYKKLAKATAQNNDLQGALMVVGLLLPLAPNDAELLDLLQKSMTAVTAGSLTKVFFKRTWQGQNVRWMITDNSLLFQGPGIQANLLNLTQEMVGVQHVGGVQYRITVAHPEANEEAVVSVMGPDRLTLVSYRHAPTSAAADQVQTITYNAPLRETKRAIGMPAPAAPPAPAPTSGDTQS